MAKLRGTRLVTVSELNEGARLNEALIKAMTGQSTMSARFMRAEWFSFIPGFKLWIDTNHRPTVQGTDRRSGIA